MAAQLTEAKQAERAFLMSVSHELKTPLAAIRGYAEALEDHAASLEEAAPVIRTEADRLERLVRDLLDLARLDRHEFTVATDTVDLAAIARQASRRYLPRARELGIELAVNAPQPSPALGDRDRLLQVVSNLVENALRYTPEGGQVTIGAQGTELSVSDTGPGIAAEDLPHVFERFYLHNKHKLDRPVGSGLGLAIVKELVTMMRGQVSVAGATGSGATFTVTLPSVTDNQPQTAQTVTHHAHS
jgi:two-component system sensor histidine kinase BaeS